MLLFFVLLIVIVFGSVKLYEMELVVGLMNFIWILFGVFVILMINILWEYEICYVYVELVGLIDKVGVVI